MASPGWSRAGSPLRPAPRAGPPEGSAPRLAPSSPEPGLSSAAMARTWSELVITGTEPAEPPDRDGEGGRRQGLFRRLRENLGKTRRALGAELQATVFQSLDDEAFERLEETLIYADVGAPTTARVVERLESEAAAGDLRDGEDLTRRLRELLAETARTEDDKIDLTARPSVVMVVGVNGSGKTTTIGKLAWHLGRELGLSSLIAAADTFRAAATEQLAEWAERAGSELLPGDPAHDRRDHGAERASAGAPLPRGGRGDRHRPDQARRHRKGRYRARHRPGAGRPGQADRRRRGDRGPPPLRPRRLRAGDPRCLSPARARASCAPAWGRAARASRSGRAPCSPRHSTSGASPTPLPTSTAATAIPRGRPTSARSESSRAGAPCCSRPGWPQWPRCC